MLARQQPLALALIDSAPDVRFVLDLVKTYRFVFPREMELLLRSILAHPVDEALVRAAAQQLLDA